MLDPSDATLAQLIREAIGTRIANEVPFRQPVLAAEYAMSNLGKLLRPLLLLRVVLACGGQVEPTLPAAAGYEFVHTGSLVHDDIIDDDDVRRGRQSVHTRFGAAQAILTGDSLIFAWFKALGDCLDHGVPPSAIARATRVQAAAGIEVCIGVGMEAAMVGQRAVPVPRYLEMARLKTGVVLGSACQVASILAGVSDQVGRQLATAGEALGIAFQIQDDLSPYVREPSAMGKPADSDLRNRRPTLPLLLGYQLGSAEDRRTIDQYFARSRNDDDGILRLREIFYDSGAYARAEAIAEEHRRRFCKLVEDNLVPSPARAALIRVGLQATQASTSSVQEWPTGLSPSMSSSARGR